MKKTYTKPMIAIENFDVTETVCSACATNIHQNANNCRLYGHHGKYYFSKSQGGNCSAGWLDANGCTQTNDGICYHGPTRNVFHS